MEAKRDSTDNELDNWPKAISDLADRVYMEMENPKQKAKIC